MNKSIRAVLIMLAVMMLAMQISFAEEPMTVEGPTISEPVPADLPEEYTEEPGSVADIFSQGEIPEEPVEPTAAPTAVPIPEEKPQEPEASYEVSFVLQWVPPALQGFHPEKRCPQQILVPLCTHPANQPVQAH